MKDHSFVAYQIFSGTQKATTEDNAPLADIQWGKGIAADSFLTALTTSKDFGENNPFANAESAEVIAGFLDRVRCTLRQTFHRKILVGLQTEFQRTVTCNRFCLDKLIAAVASLWMAPIPLGPIR